MKSTGKRKKVEVKVQAEEEERGETHGREQSEDRRERERARPSPLHTKTGNLHALSACDLQFLWTLDPTGCSCVAVLEFRRRWWVQRRWYPSKPLRLPSWHRPLPPCRHVRRSLWRHPWYLRSKIRSAQLTNCTQRFLFNSLTGGPGLLSLVLGSFKGSPPTETRRRSFFRFPCPQDKHTIFACSRMRH